MATFTVTTAVNIDTLASKAGSDTYNINGGYLTVDQHTRFGTNQNTSAAMGNITLSATLGGTIEFNSTLVRCIAYDTGSGNVPALGTTISKGSASGILLGVYSALNVAPTTAGSAMPASGYILIRQWNSVAYTTGALTGISASATAADRAGWLEIVGVDALTATCNRLGLFKVRGDYYDFQGVTTDGTRATTYQIPSNGAIVYLPGVEVETGTGTGVYEFYPCAGSKTALAANMATDEVRGRWCWISTAGLLRFGHDGTNSTGSFIPESGRKIRIPNIFFMTCTSGALTVNSAPHATIATRYEFATTGGGVIDIDKASMNWYCNFAQAFSVTLTNFNTLSSIVLSECASPIAWSNVGVGQSQSLSAIALTMSLNFAGGTMDQCTWTRYDQTATGHYVTSWTDCDGFVVTNERNHSLTRTSATNSGTSTQTRVNNSSWENTTLGASCRVLLVTCSDLSYTNTTYYDRVVGASYNSIGMYAFSIGSNCLRCTFDGLDFGGLTRQQPYSGVLEITAAGCKEIKLRNLGTAASPLDMGGAQVDATWTRATTVMTVTKTAHGLTVNDVLDVEVVSDVAPKAVTTTTATLWAIASVPDANTFTVTVTNAGAASGTLSYAPCVGGVLVALANGAAANDVKVQRCYTPHLRTGVMTGDNSSKNITFESVVGSNWGVQLMPELNATMKLVTATPALTAQTSCYGTHWFDYYTTGAPANIAAVAWTRSTTTATITSTAHGLRTGGLINVGTTSDASAIIKGQKTITATTSNAFTFTCLNAGSASGTLTFAPLNGRVAIQMNEATAETTDQVTLTNGAAFTSAGGLYMPVINDQVDFICPYSIRGHSSFPIAQAVMAGGTIANYDTSYSLDDGATYSNLHYPRAGGGGSNGSTNVTMTSTTGVAAGDYVFGTNIAPNAKVSSITDSTTVVVDIANIGAVSGTLIFNHLPSETIADPDDGFPLRLRIKTTTTNATAITSLYFYTTSTTAARAATYPLDTVTVTVTVKDASTLDPVENARVRITTDTGGYTVLEGLTDASGILTGTTEYASHDITGTVRRATAADGTLYKPGSIAGTTTADGFSTTVLMIADE